MSVAEAPRRRNPKGQGARLREEFVAAAARLLATMDRPETLTLRQVAREVGVAPASIYSHFPDLDALVQHVLRLRFGELAQAMSDAAARAGDPLDDLAARCSAYVRWGVEHPGEYRTIVGGAVPAELAPLSEPGPGEALLETVAQSLAAARADAAEATAEEHGRAGLLLWTALHGIVSLYNEHGKIDWPPVAQLVADTLTLHTGRPPGDIAAAVRSADGAT